MNDTDWAYLAGLIDGEGHLGILEGSRQGNWTVALVISNSSVAIMDWLEGHMPAGGKYQMARGPRSKRDMWQWCVWNEGIRPIISAVMPYLTAKREEAEVILLALGERQRYSYALGTGHCVPQGFRGRMKELSDRLKSIRRSPRWDVSGGVSVALSTDPDGGGLPIPLFTI